MKSKTMSKQTKSNLFENKWFIAFLVASVLAVAAIIVAIVLGVNGNGNKPPQGAFVDEGDAYYYDTVEGEIVLTLYESGNFTYETVNATKTGTYTKNGDTVNLDFFKDDDGTATATFTSGKLLMVYNDATLPFIPMVEHVVTFAGTDLGSVLVINGKTLKKPDVDPVQEGFVFFGWYADEQLTTPYDFDTTLVTSDVTIYAKWVAEESFS